MKNTKLLDNLLCLSIFTLFLPYAPYVVFFVLYILVGFFHLKSCYREKGIPVLPKGTKILLIGVSIFCLYGLFMVVLNFNMELYKYYIKLPLNLMFLITVVLCINTYKVDLKKLINTILLCMALSVIQVFTAATITGSWDLLVTGIKSSQDAYNITYTYIWFGNEAKNIWATKMVLVFFPAYLMMLHFKLVRKSTINLFLIGLIFCIIMTFSRTAILAMAAGLFFLILHWLFSKGNVKTVFRNITQKFHHLNRNKKAFVIIVSIIILAVGLSTFSKVFHFDLNSSKDGANARLITYNALLNNLDEVSLFGEGLFSATWFLPQYSSFNTDMYIHNVFLNSYLDLGIVGIISYALIIFGLALMTFRNLPTFLAVGLTTLYFVIVNLQYVGYDNDLVMYLVLTCIFINLYSNYNGNGVGKVITKKPENKLFVLDI